MHGCICKDIPGKFKQLPTDLTIHNDENFQTVSDHASNTEKRS